MSIDEKWNLIRPFWRYVRNMGPGSLCRKALSMFFDIDDLDDSAISIIQEKLNDFIKPGIYKRLFQDEHKISVCVNVVPMTEISSTAVLAPILYTSSFASVQSRNDIYMLEKASNQEIYSLETYLRAVDTVLEQGLENGLVGIKWHKLAYLRDISYPVESASAAEKCFDRILRMPAREGLASDTPVGFDEMRPFQNFIQHLY